MEDELPDEYKDSNNGYAPAIIQQQNYFQTNLDSAFSNSSHVMTIKRTHRVSADGSAGPLERAGQGLV